MYTQAYNHNNLIIKLFDSILFLSRYVNVLLNLFLVYMVFITTLSFLQNIWTLPELFYKIVVTALYAEYFQRGFSNELSGWI